MKTEENLYLKILTWAYNRQESGFTWEELKNHFNLDDSQEKWVRKIFLTTSDGDRKYFEILKHENDTYFYSLNEKGITAAINYKSLEHAEKSSEYAIWFAGTSIFLTALGLFFTIKQTNLTETQSLSDRINQARSVQSAISLCEQDSTLPDSGLYKVDTGKSVSCKEVLDTYKKDNSLLGKIKTMF